RVALRGAGSRVARRIALADVGLGFDDDARCDAGTRLVHEDLADEIARDVERGTVVKGAREALPPVARSPERGQRAWMRAIARLAAAAAEASVPFAAASSAGSVEASPITPSTSATASRIPASASCSRGAMVAVTGGPSSTRYSCAC